MHSGPGLAEFLPEISWSYAVCMSTLQTLYSKCISEIITIRCVHLASPINESNCICFLTGCLCLRDMVRQKKITMEEGTLMRTLLFMPGGLELHIGVSQRLMCLQCHTWPHIPHIAPSLLQDKHLCLHLWLPCHDATISSSLDALDASGQHQPLCCYRCSSQH